MVLTIRSKGQIRYCPECGKETAKRKQKAGKYKYNMIVECPEHGEITLSRH